MSTTAHTLLAQVDAIATRGCALPTPGFVRYREQTAAKAGLPVVVFLHGIGSGSGSWHRLMRGALPHRLLAWDAPGYADSHRLKVQQPRSQDYAKIFWAWLDALGIKQRVHIVGHSLGCIMAAGAAAFEAQRVCGLTLLSPAQGYGRASPELRQRKIQERLEAVEKLGLQAMAQQRAPQLLSPAASAQEIELACAMMSRLNPEGYVQAAYLLGHADIREDLQAAFAQQPALKANTQVACGALDTVTAPQACQTLAADLNVVYTDLGQAGHLCTIEASDAIAQLLEKSVEATTC